MKRKFKDLGPKKFSNFPRLQDRYFDKDFD